VATGHDARELTCLALSHPAALRRVLGEAAGSNSPWCAGNAFFYDDLGLQDGTATRPKTRLVAQQAREIQ
jgi:hypothetical protein